MRSEELWGRREGREEGEGNENTDRLSGDKFSR